MYHPGPVWVGSKVSVVDVKIALNLKQHENLAP